jgi:hypothetical protein
MTYGAAPYGRTPYNGSPEPNLGAVTTSSEAIASATARTPLRSDTTRALANGGTARTRLSSRTTRLAEASNTYRSTR